MGRFSDQGVTNGQLNHHRLKAFAKKEQQPYVPTVRLLTIWFGANDSVLPSERQHVPLPQFIANLKHLITTVRSPLSEYYSPETRILLISNPPVNTYQRGADLASRDPPRECDREFGVTKLYAEAVVKTAKEEDVAFADVWTALWEAAGEDERALSEYLSDGLHLTAKGYEVLDISMCVNVSIDHAFALSSPTTLSMKPLSTGTPKFTTRTCNMSSHGMSSSSLVSPRRSCS